MYYNTNKETGNTLKNSISKSNTQEDIVLDIFNKHKKLSASQVWKIYNNQLTPITSIRRAITNLCSRGTLIKTNETALGVYGKKEHLYKTIQVTENKQLDIFDFL